VRRRYKGGEDSEQYGVGRDMEVEVADAVDKYGRDPGQGSNGDAPDQAAGVPHLFESSPVEGDNHPEHDGNQW